MNTVKSTTTYIAPGGESRTWLRPVASAALLASLILGPLATGAAPAGADDGTPPGYPSWSDVTAAKDNVAAKNAEIDTINKLLDDLQTQASLLGDAAVKAGAAYAVSQNALDVQSAKLAALDAQVRRAQTQVSGLKKQAGALATQTYESGGANLGVLGTFSALQSPNGLQGLDDLQMMAQKATGLYNESQAAQQVTQALTDQQSVARGERKRLADEARQRLVSAQAAQQAAQDKVASEQTVGQTLVAQLASLKDTSAQVEGQYRQGVQAAAAFAAQQAAERQAAAAAAAQHQIAAQANAPAGVLIPNIPGGAANDPAGAEQYASSQLTAFGWSQDQFQCLARLWTQESSWLTNATNPSSGAYGIPQALPPSKLAAAGSDWLTNYRTQINWGLGYIRDRYGSPCGAWDHEVSNNWY